MAKVAGWLERATGNRRGTGDPRPERRAAADPSEEPTQPGRTVQGRRSRLIIRRVDPWTILKFSVLLFTSAYFVILVAGIVLWSIATASGVRGNIESFIGELIASDNFRFKADQLLRSSVIGGAILVVVGSLGNVLMAVLFNLISDVVGGIGISVEERPRRRSRSSSRRRPPAGRREPNRNLGR
ncbi:MAG: DUF3566 domain-containing protein [Acidimicrobiia bacterium]